MLKDSDWDTLVEWWNAWPEWTAPSKDFLPDNGKAIELLIEGAESVCKKQGIKYIFSIGRTKKLINTHKKLGYQVDDNPSYEITKQIN